MSIVNDKLMSSFICHSSDKGAQPEHATPRSGLPRPEWALGGEQPGRVNRNQLDLVYTKLRAANNRLCNGPITARSVGGKGKGMHPDDLRSGTFLVSMAGGIVGNKCKEPDVSPNSLCRGLVDTSLLLLTLQQTEQSTMHKNRVR